MIHLCLSRVFLYVFVNLCCSPDVKICTFYAENSIEYCTLNGTMVSLFTFQNYIPGIALLSAYFSVFAFSLDNTGYTHCICTVHSYSISLTGPYNFNLDIAPYRVYKSGKVRV